MWYMELYIPKMIAQVLKKIIFYKPRDGNTDIYQTADCVLENMKIS